MDLDSDLDLGVDLITPNISVGKKTYVFDRELKHNLLKRGNVLLLFPMLSIYYIYFQTFQ